MVPKSKIQVGYLQKSGGGIWFFDCKRERKFFAPDENNKEKGVFIPHSDIRT